MVKIAFGYGTTVQNVEVPDENLMGVLTANPVCAPAEEEAEIRRALREPIGSKPLSEIVNPGEKIAIVTSDITRPMPAHVVLPFLLEELFRAGVEPGDIILVFALGSHRKQTEEEKRKLVGDYIYKSIQCMDGDAEDCIHLGVTARGTPVDIVRTVAEADRRICLGNIEYHYFAGYSGGAKAIMPGVSTRAAIQSNHRMMVDQKACAGNLEDNPLRKDIEEAAAICGVDFILNVVLDEHKKVIRAFAGNVVAAHRSGCAFLDTLYQKEIDQRADIVLVSQGGDPKDLNLYQTQKALDNAKHAVKDGGTIILIGACREGLGDEVFQEWMLSASEPKQLITRVGEHFELGGHKAAAIAMVLEHAEICLVSELAPDFVRKLFLVPFQTAQDALDAAFKKAGRQARVLAMPHGGSTLPKVVPFKENGGKRKMDYAEESLQKHREWSGKIEVVSTVPVTSRKDLSLAYTPGVARPCLEIQKDVDASYELTRRHNMCLVVTDGSAVLGLGDIGPEAGMPVMEGKCVLFKTFGDVDAFPLCIKSKDVDDIVNTIYLISGSFGGVNLEDISAPRCFEIEQKLKEKCDIPIFHDDQHGTAVVTLAGLINGLKVVGKDLEEVKIVVNGAGAAAVSITRLLLSSGATDIILCDRNGAVYQGRREGMNQVKEEIAAVTNLEKRQGTLAEMLAGADVFIGVSAPGTVTAAMVKTMNREPVIFACANPTPEIFPAEASAGGAKVIATGRSDFPNQINNVLAFPGIFRGAFDVRAREINDEMKLAAAEALAGLITEAELSPEYVVPAAFDARVGGAVAQAVAKAARKSGVARMQPLQ